MIFLRAMRGLALALLIASSAAAASAVPVSAFLQTYCLDCHGPKKQKGDFRVDELRAAHNAADAEKWQLVLDALHLGEMPPPKVKDRPAEAEAKTFTQSLGGGIAAFLLERQQRDGGVVARRLTRSECERAMQELLGMRTSLAALRAIKSLQGSVVQMRALQECHS